jgi:hypothetical protein
VGINCDDIISLDGAIHCITHELGARNPVFIAHAKIRSATAQEESYHVAAVVRSSAGIDSVLTYWTTDTTAGFNALKMTYTAHDSFVTDIPGQAQQTEVFYYLTAYAHNGKIISKPLVGAKGPWKFTVEGPSAVARQSVTTPQSFVLQEVYPNPFNNRAVCIFHVAQATYIRFTLYAIDGRKIKTLASEFFNAGRHTLAIDGQNLSSGVYLLGAVADNGKATYRKIVLLK